MFESSPHPDAESLLARLDGVLDGLCALDLDTHADGEVLGLSRDLETRRNRFAVLDHACIAQVQRRHLEFTLGAKSVTVLARHVLRIDARQAHGRVKAAEALGPRLTLTGEPLDPIYRQVAAAQARGSVCEAAARVIVDMVDRLPGEIAAAKGAEVEAFLVEQAEQLDVDCIRKIAHRMSATLDPDGRFKDIAYRGRHRDLRLILRPDGSGHLDGELTAECAEHLATTFDALARPRPETDGVKDPRTAGQRRHDALVDAVKLLERAEALPHTAGVSATIVLIMTAGAYRTGAGTATSGHGAIVPASEASGGPATLASSVWCWAA